MKDAPESITIHRLSLQFDADQVTSGTKEEQASSAIELINKQLQREPYGLGAQLLAYTDEVEIVSSAEEADGQ